MTGAEDRWERLAGELEAADPAISRSTMMGLPCLRLDGAFFASLDKRTGGLIVKLDAADVSARIERGEGQPFAPAGKAFREWFATASTSEAEWRSLLADALSFARTS
jgi:hypothetical protein